MSSIFSYKLGFTIMFSMFSTHVIAERPIEDCYKPKVTLLYDYVGCAREGLSIVEKDNKWGFVDKQGKEVIPLIYDAVIDFKQGYASVKPAGENTYIDIDKTGKKVTIPPYYDDSYEKADRHLAGISDNEPFDDLSNDYPSDKENVKILCYPNYNKCHAMNRRGKILVSLQAGYEEIDDFSNDGLARVRKNNKWGFVSKLGEEVIPVKYDRANAFSEGLTMVGQKNTYYIIDENGEIITTLTFDLDEFGYFNNGKITVEKDKKVGVIDKYGKIIIPIEYNNIFELSDNSYRVEKDNKAGIINQNGKTIIPIEYDEIDDFSQNLTIVTKDGKKGIINKQGKIIIPIKLNYDYMFFFSEDLIKIQKDNKRGIINKQGKIIIPIEYDEIDSFSKNLTIVTKDEKKGFINTQGKIILPIKYQEISMLSENLAKIQKDGKWGFINEQGKIVIPIEFDQAENFIRGTTEVEKAGQVFEIDKHGKRIH